MHPAQYEAETASSLPGEGCPPESKIGSIEIETPLLNEKIPGAIYIAKPYDNPFGEEATPTGRCSRCMSWRRTPNAAS